MKRAVGDRLAVAYSAGDLAWAEIERAHYDEARALLEEALGIFIDSGQKDGIAECFEALARISKDAGEGPRAARLYGSAAALRDEIGVSHHPADLPRHEAALNDLREHMGPGPFSVALEIGQEMPLDEVVQYATRGNDDVQNRRAVNSCG